MHEACVQIAGLCYTRDCFIGTVHSLRFTGSSDADAGQGRFPVLHAQDIFQNQIIGSYKSIRGYACDVRREDDFPAYFLRRGQKNMILLYRLMVQHVQACPGQMTAGNRLDHVTQGITQGTVLCVRYTFVQFQS